MNGKNATGFVCANTGCHGYKADEPNHCKQFYNVMCCRIYVAPPGVYVENS